MGFNSAFLPAGKKPYLVKEGAKDTDRLEVPKVHGHLGVPEQTLLVPASQSDKLSLAVRM